MTHWRFTYWFQHFLCGDGEYQLGAVGRAPRVPWGLGAGEQVLWQGFGNSRSQAGLLNPWVIPTFLILESLCVHTSNRASFLAGTDSGEAWPMCTALSKATGAGVGISLFVKTRARAQRGRHPRLGLHPWDHNPGCFFPADLWLQSPDLWHLQLLSNQFHRN